MDTPLDDKSVRRPERELERAIANLVARLGARRLPLLPEKQDQWMALNNLEAVQRRHQDVQQERRLTPDHPHTCCH